jgi:hypothetical protein
LGFLQKKNIFIEYLVQVLWLKGIGAKCLIIFDEPKGGVENI